MMMMVTAMMSCLYKCEGAVWRSTRGGRNGYDGGDCGAWDPLVCRRCCGEREREGETGSVTVE